MWIKSEKEVDYHNENNYLQSFTIVYGQFLTISFCRIIENAYLCSYN